MRRRKKTIMVMRRHGSEDVVKCLDNGNGHDLKNAG